MHVLQIGKYLPPIPGGMETAVFELSSGLSQLSDLQVSCLVSNTTPKTIYERVNNFDVVRASRLGTIASTPISFSYGREGRKIEADVLHFHLPNPLATASFGVVKKPYVVTYHCDIVKYRKLLKIYEPSMKNFLAKAAKIIVASSELVDNSGILQSFKDKCVVIPLAIDSEALALTESRKRFKEHLVKKFGERIVLFVGRLVKYKGVNDLIRAMKDVDGKLLIVGSGPELENLKINASQSGVAGKISFEGYVSAEDLPAYYHAARVVALTSIDSREAFGMCLLEGLACGTPLVTTKLPTGIATVNMHGITGYQVPVGDTEAIAGELNLILNDEALREKLSVNARAHFIKNFTRESMTQAHFKLYQEVLAK